MTAATPADDAAWAALLPGGTVWLSRPPRRAEPQITSAGFAAGAAPWSLRSRPGRRVRSYVAVPSRRRPLIVASWDRAVLRYLADSLVSAVLTAGLRMFRYPGSWRLAVALRAGGAVLVGRAE
jgi:hypothetical protein